MFGTFRIQAEQTIKDGVNSCAIPAYAYTMNAPVDNMLAMAFKPLASVLKLTVAPYDIAVEKIVIAPAEGATVTEGAIAGTFAADAANGTIKVSNELNTLTVTPSAPIDMKQGATLDIPMGWFTVDGGLAITMIYEGGKEYPITLWKDAGAVKSYNDEGGLKSAKAIAETIEFDSNSFPRAWYVKADATASGKGISWETATSLDFALETALPGSVLHLAAGTYKPQTAIKYMSGSGEEAVEAPAEEGFKTFLVGKNITIIGGYPANATTGAVADAANNATVLDGDSKAYHTMIVAAPKTAGEKVVLEGITIKGGKNTATQKTLTCTFNEYTLLGNYAAGLALVGTAVDMKNVTVKENAGHSAAGLYCMGTDVNMTKCTVSNNTADGNGAGAWFTNETNLVMDDCDIVSNNTASICSGLYLYVPAEHGLQAEIKNSRFNNNIASGNAGGAYIRDDSGSFMMKSSFTNCSFNGNTGGMGAAVLVLNAKTSFGECTFDSNRNSGNGLIYCYTSGDSSLEVLFDKCNITNNACGDGAAGGCIGGLYVYGNSTGSVKAYVLNSLIANNSANGRGGAVYLRNNGTDHEAYLACVNSTITGNASGSLGSAVNLYGAAAKKSVADIISCTIIDNLSKHETNKGALCCETAGTTMNVYNTLVAGNHTAENVACDFFNKAGTMTHKYTLAGGEYYGADGAAATVTPAFDVNTMIGSLADNGGKTKTMKLSGNASSNPAFGNGMAVADLKALAKDHATAEILAKDQIGTDRTDTDKVIGACAKK